MTPPEVGDRNPKSQISVFRDDHDNDGGDSDDNGEDYFDDDGDDDDDYINDDGDDEDDDDDVSPSYIDVLTRWELLACLCFDGHPRIV